VLESIWSLPKTTPYQIDARFEIVGTEGAIYLDCGDAGVTIHDGAGTQKPDTVYWPRLHARSVGGLRTELSYFADCVRQGKRPDIITPEESRTAVEVICAAEASAESGQVVNLS